MPLTGSTASALPIGRAPVVSGSEPRDHVSRIDDQQLITPDDLSRMIDDADSIRIAVESDSNVGTVAFHRSDEIAQVFRNRRIGMMIWKCPVAFAEKAAHRNSELFEQ